MNIKEPTGQVARWLERLAEFDFQQARLGKRHGNADGLSRRPPETDGERSDAPVISAVSKEVPTNWCPNWKSYEIRREQMADATFGRILAWRERNAKPPSQIELQGPGPAVHKLCSYWNPLEVQNGALNRRWEDEQGDSTRLLVVVPKSLVPEVLSALHDSPIAGHLGVTKKLEKVRERFYWPGQRADVEDWLQHCETCATGKAAQSRPRAPLVSCMPGYPLERIASIYLVPCRRQITKTSTSWS